MNPQYTTKQLQSEDEKGMAAGVIKKEPDAREVYADIIDLPHYEPKKHPRMSLYNRAAQFAPFAALTGYNEMIEEEARKTAELPHN